MDQEPKTISMKVNELVLTGEIIFQHCGTNDVFDFTLQNLLHLYHI